MSAMSNYLEGEIIKHIFRSGTFSKPTVLAMALFTGSPTDEDSATEISGNGYGRAQLNPADANWDPPSSGDGMTLNLATITFPTPTGSWGTVTHFGIYDSPSAGNLLFWGALGDDRTITTGDSVSFSIGQLGISFD
jgi:hypothetical protein